MSVTIEELIHDVSELASLPEVSLRVNQLVEDPNSSVNEIGEVISQDPALSARLLRIANSPFYGFSATIDTISRAVTVLGTQQIRDLVLSSTATAAFDGIPNEIISVDDFWHHSLYCGILARELAMQNHKAQGEMLFTAGLLHDIGHLVLFNRLPELAHQAIMRTLSGDNISLYLAEHEIMGFDHAQLGGALAKAWQLPQNLCECVQFHHQPEKAQQFPVEVMFIHLANDIASLPYESDDQANSSVIAHIPQSSLKLCRLNPEHLPVAIERAREQISDLQSLLFSD